MIRNLHCTVTIDSVLVNSKTQNAFLFTVNAIFLHDYPVAVEPTKKTWRDSLPIDMLLSAVSVLVVAQSSSEIPEGLMNNPVILRKLPTTLYQSVMSTKCMRELSVWNVDPDIMYHYRGYGCFLGAVA